MMNWDGDRGWGDHMDGVWGWLGGTMMILWILLLVLAIVAVAVWLVRTTKLDRDRSPDATGEPRRIIDERFARGEIDADTRRQMLDTLS